MSNVKQIVCLANSRKLSGRCVAGKEVVGSGYGGWIRPISARPSAEVSEDERRYENGVEPRLLDIVEIPIIGATPHLHQSENHVIDAERTWAKKGEVPWIELKKLLDKPASLWVNEDSSRHGLNDRVRQDLAAKLTNSLLLIEPEDLTITVQNEGSPKRRVRAEFKFKGTTYKLIVTDPIAEQVFLGKPNGTHPVRNAYLCVSLTEEFDGSCYKLVAAVISKEPL